jgi:hypothetical protein
VRKPFALSLSKGFQVQDFDKLSPNGLAIFGGATSAVAPTFAAHLLAATENCRKSLDRCKRGYWAAL